MTTDALNPSGTPPRSVNRFLWVALASAACLLALGVALLLPREEPLQRLGKLPAFTFTRQDGQPFGLQQLEGRPWVANFIFTRCPTICPVFTAKLARFQKQTADMGGELALVSFSVDPKYDTPERLTAYAAKYGADPARWSFLTGDYEQLKQTVVGGFKIAMGRNDENEDDIPSIFHGSHFVLVDRTGEIRGYYNSEDDDAVERLRRDAGRLVRGGE
ncbi:SCO family protein [Vitiosangium sp. GDMCC 1.1324]|uniref:SCO family protein n=1 Tax=Vitiosangium sp. (strain GDMCC 1.1324) TaxID=2138576 RepID=UPI000D3AC993|nr:SCO family protein [Vitiosangium sp. GDMCC 1.1324]PTL79616.1 photosynthetic protein synthase I [Vitiosangium sp. GDMCC 1.1324]